MIPLIPLDTIDLSTYPSLYPFHSISHGHFDSLFLNKEMNSIDSKY